MPEVSVLQFILDSVYPVLTDPTKSLFLPKVILDTGNDPFSLGDLGWELDFPNTTNPSGAPATLVLSKLQIVGNANVMPNQPIVSNDEQTVTAAFQLCTYPADTVPGLAAHIAITGNFSHNLILVGQTFVIGGTFTASVSGGMLNTSSQLVVNNDIVTATANAITLVLTDEQIADFALELVVSSNFKPDIAQQIQTQIATVLNSDTNKRLGIQKLNDNLNSDDTKQKLADMLTTAINHAFS